MKTTLTFAKGTGKTITGNEIKSFQLKLEEKEAVKELIIRIVNSNKKNLFIEQIRNRISEGYTLEKGLDIITYIYEQGIDNLEMTIKMWGEDVVNDINRYFTEKK